MVYQARGVLKTVNETVKEKNDFQKRQFIIEMNNFGRVENIAFDLYQTHCNYINSFNIGDKILVSFNIKCRKWSDPETKKENFTTALQAWKIETDSIVTAVNKYDTRGTVYQIFDAVKVTKDFTRRSFVIEIQNLFQGRLDFLSFDLIQDHCKLIDNFEIGDPIIVHFNLKSRQWTTPEGALKTFNNLKAYKLEHITE